MIGFLLLLTMPFPIQFSIPECKVVQEIPVKTRDFSIVVPGAYIYHVESDYYNDYQSSYFAITTRKGGWDCLRHYEILANGCIPYFIGLENCPKNTMRLLPKELILEAMHLEGVSHKKIDHTKFNLAKYYEILNKLLAHTRKYLTSERMAEYLLQTLNYSGKGKILFLSGNVSPDYLRCLTLIGLKQYLGGDRVIDFPKVPHIYKSCLNPGSLYGRGFTYTRILDDPLLNRERIEERIRNKEFDLIIYGSVARGTPLHDLVKQIYEQEKIVYLNGEDSGGGRFVSWPNLFLREF